MAECTLCGKQFKLLTNTHLEALHQITIKDYQRKFGNESGFVPFSPSRLPKSDVRYIKWQESLKNRPVSWSKGYTKKTHPSIAKISETFKTKGIDNFAAWRKKMKKQGRILSVYSPFALSGDLAELIGVVLGDGHIEKFPRTERLSIFSNANNKGFVERYERIVFAIFNKKPISSKRNESNCIKIDIYQKDIAKRLGIPSGARKNISFQIPEWILENREYLKRYLRGLYEVEGSFSVHKPTCTYKFIFKNTNNSLLDNVYGALKLLDFHPHRSIYQIQISRKEEVYRVQKVLQFRKY